MCKKEKKEEDNVDRRRKNYTEEELKEIKNNLKKETNDLMDQKEEKK